MKYLILILTLFLAYTLNAQESFSSKQYNFRITFPKGWEVSTKDKKYVVEASENDNIELSINATIYYNLSDSFNISYIQIDSLKKIIENQMSFQYQKYLVLRSGKGQIDGVPAYFYFIQYSDYKDGYLTKFISFQYQFIYRRVFYSMFGVFPASVYEDYEKIFNQTYFTFRFLEKM